MWSLIPILISKIGDFQLPPKSDSLFIQLMLIRLPVLLQSDYNQFVNIFEFKERNFINVITKNEDFQTLDGDKGVKIFGSFDDQNLNRKKDYSTILFVVNKLSIKLEIIFERGNANLQKIVDRVINSLKFKHFSDTSWTYNITL